MPPGGIAPHLGGTLITGQHGCGEAGRQAGGLGGVPAVILDRQLIISGAQPAAAMAEAIRASLRAAA
jgi:predicted DsbA family dithiol-disulfide isomerase